MKVRFQIPQYGPTPTELRKLGLSTVGDTIFTHYGYVDVDLKVLPRIGEHVCVDEDSDRLYQYTVKDVIHGYAGILISLGPRLVDDAYVAAMEAPAKKEPAE